MNFRTPMLGAAAIILALGAAACSTDLSGPSALDDTQIDADIAATSGDAVASEIAGFSDNVAAAGSFTTVAPSFNVTVGSGSQPRLNGISPTCSYTAPR